MKIKNNGLANASYRNNQAAVERILIPAGSVLELNDSVWECYKKACSYDVKSGALTIVKAPVLTPKEQAAAKAKAVLEAKKFLQENKEVS